MSEVPTLYSPEWWDGRVDVLRKCFPRGLDQASQDRLDRAMFGPYPTREQIAQSTACYLRAWPLKQPEETPWPI